MFGNSKKPKDFLISLRVSILSIFIIFILLTSFIIIAIRYLAFEDEVNYTAKKIIYYISNNVLEELTRGVRPIEFASRFTAKVIQDGVLDETEEELVKYTFDAVQTLPLIKAAFWGNERGDFITSRKLNDNTVASTILMRNNPPYYYKNIVRDKEGNIIKIEKKPTDFDPRTREWYKQVKNRKSLIWTDIYPFYPDGFLGITVASPIFDERGNVKSVFGFDISLEYLKTFITNQLISLNGYAFIITSKEDLVAYPDEYPFTSVKRDSNKLINVHEIKLPLIDKSLDYYKRTKQNEFEMDFAGERYLVTYQVVPQFIDYGWLIGVITEKKDFVRMLHQLNLITGIVCFLILGIGIIFVSNLVSRIVKPLNLLMEETENIKHLKLDEDVPIVSRIKEIFYLKNAVFSMKQGLKQFQKYLPKILVRQLIESGQDIRIGGERKELVVFFSDIQNFTSIAEKMDPNELTIQMCEYFETLSQIILGHKGTIDKYIGDSVMAFWGAPLLEKDPWISAAKSALDCQEKIAEQNRAWASQGKPAFITRIGIHMGDAIVGNLGSHERLNYTALGDTINIASRIEAINKIYRTHILVSGEVYEKIKNSFTLRFVDCVELKGRLSTINIYELLSDNKHKLDFDYDAYQREFSLGYLAYKEKRLDVAITHFQTCMKIYPADSIAPIFIERCASQKLK